VSEPRVLAIMGSGEIAPTMARVHRALFDRFGSRQVPAVIIDTPYGFQENADDLSARTVDFFRDSVGRDFSVASYRSRDVGPIEEATALARIGEAAYIMAGPGSPTYLLRHWRDGPIPDLLARRLASGAIVTLASAAAVTLGVVTMPVYEIYKVGESPRWIEGLDLLGAATGLRAAVVPHYDNAEGGNHDTRFCYVGERRLRVLEAQLPKGAFVLGIDGHTALILDLADGTASVAGLGGVTVRSGGRSTVFASGRQVPIGTLAEAASDLRSGAPGVLPDDPAAGPATVDPVPSARRAIGDDVAQLEGTFVAGLETGDVSSAVAALLELGATIEARVRAGEDSPDLDGAGSRFRSLIIRLGEAAVANTRDPREVVGPHIEALLELRDAARASRDWSTADLIRDRLVAAGVEVHDGEVRSTWTLAQPRQGVAR
jgi:cyanophycinase-like exopeptidase